MSQKAADFEQALSLLQGEKAMPTRVLKAFSHMDERRLAGFQDVWPALHDRRRAYVVLKLRAMAEIDPRLDFTPVFRFTLSDVDEQVRLASIEGLAEDESLDLIDPLAVLLRSDLSPRVRAAAARALGHFMYLGVMDRLPQRRRDQVYSALMGALIQSPEDSPVRRAALRAIAFVWNDAVDQQIRDAYASDHTPLRVSAVHAMGRTNERRYAPVVMNELHSVTPALRREAARAAGELELEDAVKELAQLVDDPDVPVRRAALTALGQIGGQDAKAILDRAIQSNDPEIQDAAEEALGEYELMHGDLKFSMGAFDDFFNGLG